MNPPPAVQNEQTANIILTGMPGSGKSAAGRELAKLLRRPHADIDAQIEQTAGATIPALFAEYGEAHFRKLETAALKKILAQNGQIISTGGGAVLSAKNRALIQTCGCAVYLSAPLPLLCKRLQKDAAARPLLASGNLEEKLAALLQKREKFYQQIARLAVVQHREDTPAAVAKKIAAGLRHL